MAFRVFVCSTRSDLALERSAVLGMLNGLKLEHGSMESFGARPGLPLETCLDEVQRSDILVVIVGHRYGSLANETGISFTEAEYNEAVRLSKPILAYVLDESVPVLPQYVDPDADKRARLEQWKAVLAARHTLASFRQSQDLASRVSADLHAHLARVGISTVAPQGSNKVLLLESEAEDTLYEAISALGNKLTDVDDQVTSLIANTNATGFSTDEVEILEVGHFVFSDAGIPFRARIRLTGDSDDESVFHGDTIFVDVTGTLRYDGAHWMIGDYDSVAELEDVAGDEVGHDEQNNGR